MWTMLLLLFTVLTSFVLIVALPALFVWALIKWRREHTLVPLLRFLSIAGGLAIGMGIAWSIVVVHYGWHLSLAETFYAGWHSDIYGGEVEDAAESFFFFTLFFGDVGAILAGVTGWLATKRQRELVLTN